jgi:hypothetical protein
MCSNGDRKHTEGFRKVCTHVEIRGRIMSDDERGKMRVAVVAG